MEVSYGIFMIVSMLFFLVGGGGGWELLLIPKSIFILVSLCGKHGEGLLSVKLCHRTNYYPSNLCFAFNIFHEYNDI